MNENQPRLRPETYVLEGLVQTVIARARECPDDVPFNTLLYLGDRETTVPPLLMKDLVLNPVDKILWMALYIAASETEDGADFPGYPQLAVQVNVASPSTIARAVAILRITRWLTLCARCRGNNGRYRSNLYALHDEPISVADAQYLDPGYLTFLSKSLAHNHARVRRVAQVVQDAIDADSAADQATSGNECTIEDNKCPTQSQDSLAQDADGNHHNQKLVPVGGSSSYIYKIITTEPQSEKVCVDQFQGKSLIYPRRLSANQRALAEHYLRLIPTDQQQMVLDELEGRFRSEQKGMSPLYDELRFLHRLCRLVIEGGFVPNLGIKVLDERLERTQERLKRQEHQAACHAAAKRRAANPDHDPLAEIKKTLGTARHAKKDESAC